MRSSYPNFPVGLEILSSQTALVPDMGTCYIIEMKVIKRSHLIDFYERHPETKASLVHWMQTVKVANWRDPNDVLKTFPKAKTLTPDRVRFEIHGKNYRLIVSFHWRLQLAFIKFIGTHAQYDRVDARTVSQY